MKYTYVLALCLCCSIVAARENPFEKSQIVSDVNSTNVISVAQNFERVNINLPSDAREIDSVIVKYKSLDGSIKSKSVNINASFDWRDPLVFAKATSNDFFNVVQKPTNKLSDEEISNIANKTDASFLGSLEFENRLRLDVFTNKIIVNTSDILLKSYNEGVRIVLDLAKTDIDFASRGSNFKNGVLKRANISSHGKFYRLVLHLDSHYKYSIHQDKDGYAIWLSK